MKKCVEMFGIRESTVGLIRLINIALSLERDVEYSITEISARASLSDEMTRKVLDGLEYFGIFKRNARNNKYFVPEGN